MTDQGRKLMAELAGGMEELLPEKGERQILLNALDVFARKGAAGAKISDIARKAGFSQGFVYNYFKSKDEIYTRLIDLAAEGAGATARKAAAMDGTPYARIYWMTEALLSPESIAMSHWRLIMLQGAASEAAPAEARRIAREKAGLPFKHMVPLVAEGQRLGEIRQGDPLMLSITYFSIVQGLGIARIQGGETMPFPSVELILAFLRTPDCPETPAN